MKFIIHNFLFLLLGCLLLASNPLFSQTTRLNDKISFSVNNVPVSRALEALSRSTGVSFSYNPDQLPASRIVKVDMQNRTLSEVIGAILNSSSFGYKQMGNQIIIYRNQIADDKSGEIPEDKPDQEAGVANDAPRTKPQVNSTDNNLLKSYPDTVYLVREVHDTIRLTDVVVKYDTIIQKVSTPVSSSQIFHVNLGEQLSNNISFDAGIVSTLYLPHSSFTAPDAYSGKVSQYEESYSNNVFSGTAGIELRAHKNRLTAGTGFFLSIFSQKLDYNYNMEEGGYFRRDTLDPYFTINDGDTTWYYIVDSTYIPVDNKLFSYKVNNHFKYIDVPITIQYNVPYLNSLIFAKAGLIAGILTGADGHLIKPDEEGIISVAEISPKKFLLSYMLSAGVAVPINKSFTFNTALQYRSHFGSLYNEFPITVRVKAIGVSAGIVYKL